MILELTFNPEEAAQQKINKIAKKNKLFVVEDAAQSFGGEFMGIKSGAFSDLGAFSMNPMKPLSGYGEGGLVVTDNIDFYEKIKILRYAGTTSDPKKLVTNFSYSPKMDTINASMLLVSFKYFEKKKKRLEEIRNFYEDNLDNKIIRQKYRVGEIPGRYSYPIQIKNRDKIKQFLDEKNIETKIWNDAYLSLPNL